MNTELKFEDWCKHVLESMDAAPAAPAKTESAPTTTSAPASSANTEVKADAKTSIISDVDTIMNNLAQLSVQIKETVDTIEVFETEELNEEELNEDQAIFELTADEAGSKLADWIYYAPKYRKMQQKVNKMKMNSLDIQIAIDNLSDEEMDSTAKKAKKDVLSSKRSTLQDQIKDLQDAIDTKARERGEYIGKVLSSEKIKGQMALVKRSSGQEDDPKKQKDLAASMKELQQRFNDEQAAMKELTDKEKQKKANSTQKPAKEPKKEEPKKEEPKKEEPKKEEPKAEEPKKEEPKKEEPKNKAAELEADIKSYNNNIAEERAAIEKAKEELKTEKDPEKIAKLKDSIQQSKEDITEMQAEIKKLKDDFKKSAPAKESLIFVANELGLNEMASEIATKQDWQFENNSALYVKYNTEIEKQSALKKINESTAISIADKFRMLLG
jgi:hypothetical protein